MGFDDCDEARFVTLLDFQLRFIPVPVLESVLSGGTAMVKIGF